MTFVLFLKNNSRWLAGGFLLTFFSSFGQTYFIALFGGHLRHEFSLTHGEFGSLYMAATLLSAATLPFLGRIVDVVSVARTCVLSFSALAVCALAMASVPSVLVLFGVLYGLRLFGQGMMTHIAMTAMGRWYEAQRGRAVAIASSGLQTGEALLPVCFVAISAAFGWRQSWWIALMLLLVALPVAYLLMREERTPRGKSAHDDHGDQRQWTRGEVLRDAYFWLVMIAELAPPFIGTAIFFHQVHLVEIKGWSLETFASSFVVMSVSTVAFGLVFGVLIDRFSAVRMLPFFLVPMGFASILIAHMEAPASIFLFMALFGVSYGGSSAIIGTLWPEIYGVRHLGAIRAIVVALMVLSSAVGPGITGILIDWGVPFEVQLSAMGFYCFAAALAMVVVSKHLRSRQSAPSLMTET